MKKFKKIIKLTLYITIFFISVFGILKLSCEINNEAFIISNMCPTLNTIGIEFANIPLFNYIKNNNIQLMLFVFTAGMSLVIFFTELFFSEPKNIENLIIFREDKKIKKLIKDERAQNIRKVSNRKN